MTTSTAEDVSTQPVRFRSHVELILNRADEQPGRVMMSDASHRVTAAQFARGVRNAAGDLLARGIKSGAVVALAAPISLEAVVVRYAAGLIGCATVLCPHAADADRVRRFVSAAEADELVCFPSTAAVSRHVTGAVSRAHVITAVDLDSDSDRTLADSPDVDPDALAVLVTSGGTTGDPKASRRTFAGWNQAIAIGPCPTRRQLICTPLAYIAQILMDQTLLGGGSVILRDHFDAAEVLATIEAERITNLCLVEPWLVELADHPDVDRRDLSSLVAVSHIGADAAPSLRRRLLGRLGPCLAHPYGASEAGLISLLGSDEYVAGAGTALGSAGRLLPGVEIRIEAPDGAPVVGSQVGRIVVGSSGVARDYAGGRDSSAFRAGGWYDTGDYGYLDAAGLLHVRGRGKDERLLGATSSFPVDVQDRLCSQSDVAYAVAIPAEDDGAGFDAVVVLRARPGTTQVGREELLASSGVNRLVISDHIPVTEQGKPDRRALRALLDQSS